MRRLLIVLALGVIAQTAFATTIHVPADQPTIQAGINAAVNGDTVLVAPGKTIPLSQVLTPDGKIDLNAIKASGYQGSVDIKGFNIDIDSMTGAPMARRQGGNSPQDSPDDAYWDNSISPCIPGTNGTVRSLTVYDGKLIVGGSFSIARNVPANNIAMWDGSSWLSLGTGVDSMVYALSVYDGRLIAGGSFITAGGLPANRIASWDGSSWASIGLGTDNVIRALTVYNNKLIVGGGFITAGGVSSNRIAAWDGSVWSPLGTGMDSSVFALGIYEGNLIAAGAFATAGGFTANNIASWDGTTWSSLGSGMGGYRNVLALAVYGNKLIAGGEFSVAGTSYIAAWDGSSWLSLGFGMNGPIYALAIYNEKLIAGGLFDQAPGVAVANHIAVWDGSSWSPIGTGLDDHVWALAIFDNKVVMGGTFTRSGNVSAYHVTSWDGSSWSSFGSGIGGGINSLSVYGNKLIAGGAVISAWDGATWSPFGSGMIGRYPQYNRILALTVYNDRLIAGGLFTSVGGITVNYIAAWDGISWSALGSGMDMDVYALTVFNNNLIAGGCFSRAGNIDANNIAAWDGSSWTALGAGLNSTITAVTVYNNKLIAGGYFTKSGDLSVSRIASWDGSSWSALGSGTNGSVNAVTVYDNRLVVGGSFAIAGSVPANNIAAWDGSSWQLLGSGTDGTVSALAVYDGKLIAGGSFTTAGGVPASRIASWDGILWASLGSGVGSSVTAFAVKDNLLAVGGYFEMAGNKVSISIAQWTIGYKNIAPQITSLDTASATEDIRFLYHATATDPDGPSLTFAFINRPSWLTSDADSIFGTPHYGNRDTSFVVIASDGFLADTQLVNLTVHQVSPEVTIVRVDNDTLNLHVVSHTPLFNWHYYDPTESSPQTEFEIGVGTDTNWTYSEMWNPAPYTSTDSFVQYNGSSLSDGITYYLRLRAYNGSHWSPWKDASFRMNSRPSLPVQKSPIGQVAVTTVNPALYVANSTDAEGDALQYGFQVYSDTLSGTPVASANSVAQQADSTEWIVNVNLIDNSRYFWRARAFDGYEYSDWSPYASFWVNATPQAPGSFYVYFPPDTDRAQIYDFPAEFWWGAAADPDPLDTVHYKLLVAIDSNFTFAASFDSLYVYRYPVSTLNYSTHYWWKVLAIDKTGNTTPSTNTADFWTWVLGDVNHDYKANVGDVVFLINFIFKGGYVPAPMKTGDVNSDCKVNVGDAVYMINYIFKGGLAPKVGCAAAK